MFQAIYFDPNLLRVLPKDMHGSHCSVCDKPQAQWELMQGKQENNAICSLCMLYKSNWAEKYGDDLIQFIRKVEARAKLKFEMNANQQLLKVGDADRILGALVLTSKVFKMQERLHARRTYG